MFLAFLHENLGWILLLIGLLVLFVAHELYFQAKSVKKLKPQAVIDLMNQKKAIVIDVREKKEFKTGHLTGALHMPLGSLPEKIESLSKEETYVMVCHLGHRAQEAATLLKKKGFLSIYVLSGGVAAWSADGFPLVK